MTNQPQPPEVNEMRKGVVKISPILICEALQFPADWKIEGIHMDKFDSYATAVISGPDFPEVLEIKECKIICHQEPEKPAKRSYEVEEVK